MRPSPVSADVLAEVAGIAAERLGVLPSECVFTDDKPDFCEAARQAGMQAIVYTDFVQFTDDLKALLRDAEN